MNLFFLPAQDTEDEIEHEERSDDDQGNEEHPVEGAAYRVVGLKENIMIIKIIIIIEIKLIGVSSNFRYLLLKFMIIVLTQYLNL